MADEYETQVLQLGRVLEGSFAARRVYASTAQFHDELMRSLDLLAKGAGITGRNALRNINRALNETLEKYNDKGE